MFLRTADIGVFFCNDKRKWFFTQLNQRLLQNNHKYQSRPHFPFIIKIEKQCHLKPSLTQSN